MDKPGSLKSCPAPFFYPLLPLFHPDHLPRTLLHPVKDDHLCEHNTLPASPVSWDAQLSLCIRPWWCHLADSSCKIAPHSCPSSSHSEHSRYLSMCSTCTLPQSSCHPKRSQTYDSWKDALSGLPPPDQSLSHLRIFAVGIHSFFSPFTFCDSKALPGIPYISEMHRRFLHTARNRNSR